MLSAWTVKLRSSTPGGATFAANWLIGTSEKNKTTIEYYILFVFVRLRSCEAAYNLLKNYHKSKEVDDNWLDETYGKLNSLQPIKERAKEYLEPTRVSFLHLCFVMYDIYRYVFILGYVAHGH